MRALVFVLLGCWWWCFVVGVVGWLWVWLVRGMYVLVQHTLSLFLYIHTHSPYVRLSEYELCEEADTLRWKLQTDKRGGCQGEGCGTHDDMGTFRCVGFWVDGRVCW